MKTTFVFLFLALCGSSALAQTNTFPWPPNPKVGIGTQSSIGGPINSLHVHYKPADTATDTAILRLSEGDTTYGNVYGILGLMPYPKDTDYTSLSRGTDLVLHEHSGGDLILTNFNPGTVTHPSGSIRLATTPDGSDLPMPIPHRDIERVTVLKNGNVGIDLPQNIATNAGLAYEQVQIGGGKTPIPGDSVAVPGLFIYGGNPYEGLPLLGGGTAPIDWRYIGFNNWVNHMDATINRFHRLVPMSSAVMSFAANDNVGDGGMIDLHCMPYDVARGLDNMKRGVDLHMMGSKGIEAWCATTDSDQYHHLFDCWIPGFKPWPITRNDNGLFFHRTPVYIGLNGNVDFTSLTGVYPTLGDGHTWMLAVDGAALAKEFYVSMDWPDYVFDAKYKLMPLRDVEKYIDANHHLPGVESADSLAKTGVPLGTTEAKLMQKIEELTLYSIGQNKRIEAMEREIDLLKKGVKEQ